MYVLLYLVIYVGTYMVSVIVTSANKCRLTEHSKWGGFQPNTLYSALCIYSIKVPVTMVILSSVSP